MTVKITKKDFLENLIKFGIKRIGLVPLSIQKDKAMLKVALQEDPEVLLFVPKRLHTPENFWNTNPKKRYILLSSESISKKVPAKMIEWIVDERTSIVGMPFFQEKFPQFDDLTEHAKTKLAASFCIEKRKIPEYIELYTKQFSSMDVAEIKDFKSNLILMESLGKIMGKQSSISNNKYSEDDDNSANNVLGAYSFVNKL